jgi:hypothetical protein
MLFEELAHISYCRGPSCGFEVDERDVNDFTKSNSMNCMATLGTAGKLCRQKHGKIHTQKGSRI